jgi:hypothetical protein
VADSKAARSHNGDLRGNQLQSKLPYTSSHELLRTCHCAGAANGGIDGKAAGVAAQIQDALASRQALHQGTAVPLIRIESCKSSLSSGFTVPQISQHAVALVDGEPFGVNST